MKGMIAALLLACCMCVAAVADEAGDLRAAGPPGEYQLLLENESVQVLRIRIAPRERTPMHDVTPRVVHWLADAQFVDRFPDGTTREEMRKAGDVEWVSTRRQAGENVGDTPMEFVAVVLKSLASATSAPEHGRTPPIERRAPLKSERNAARMGGRLPADSYGHVIVAGSGRSGENGGYLSGGVGRRVLKNPSVVGGGGGFHGHLLLVYPLPGHHCGGGLIGLIGPPSGACAFDIARDHGAAARRSWPARRNWGRTAAA